MPADTSIIKQSFLSSARSSLTSSRDYKAAIQLLDDNETIVQEFKKTTNAQAILDYVCEYLNLVEKDYFGLRFQDLSKHRYWLDLNKPICKQMDGPNIGLRLRVCFYPSDVTVVKEEITRYQLFVQLQRDLLHGRLYCPQNEAAVLGGLILQSVVGDYDPEKHTPGYVSEYKILLKQTAKMEDKIEEAHKTFKGLTASQAEMEFLKRASKLDTYGFDPYTIVDKQGQTVYLGVTHKGIYIYHLSTMVHHITWDELKKVDYLGKDLYIVPVPSYVSPFTNSTDQINGNEKPASVNLTVLKYHCPSAKFAKHLWRHILSQQAFFTENDAKHIKPRFSRPRIPLLSRGSTFRFPTSRVLHEIEAEGTSRRDGPQPLFTRYTLQKQPRRQFAPMINKYNTLPPMHMGSDCSTAIPESDEMLGTSDDSFAVHSVPPIMEEQQLLEESLPEPVPESDPEPESPSNAEHINQAMFTIHLCRRDPLPSHSCEKVDSDGESKFRVEESVSSFSAMSPLFTSTPLKEFDATEKLCLRERTPPVVLNEVVEVNELVQSNASGGLLSSAAKYFFSCLLLLLLISALAVAVFENQPTWFESYQVLDDFRHSYYEPMRRFIVTTYDNLGRR